MGPSGKYSEKKRRFRVPIAAWVLLLIAGATAITGTVTAWLSAATKPVENRFQTALSPTPTVSETFDQKTKTNVSVDVGNPGYAVYVRAAVVVTWKNEAGDVFGKAPQPETDYTVSYNKTDWFEKDGFWYCKAPLNSGKTPVLIQSCAPVEGKAPEGYSLNVEIIAQTVQALGTTDTDGTPAVTDAWGVAVTNGQLSPAIG